MTNKSHQARVAALSIAQMTTVVNLLHAHGQNEHAANVEAAKNAVVDIVRNELGGDALAEALKLISDELDGMGEVPAALAIRH